MRIPALQVACLVGLISRQNHAKSVLYRDMTAMNVKRTKDEPVESIGERSITRPQNGNSTDGQQNGAPLKLEGSLEGTGSAPDSDIMMVDSQPSAPTASVQFEHTNKSNEITNGELPGGQQMENKNQDDDLFGAEPSPLPIDLSMDDATNVEQTPKLQDTGAGSSVDVVNNQAAPSAGGNEDDLDALFNQNDTTGPDDLNLDTNANQQDAGMDSLLPGLEFYANENNATPGGGLEGLGDLTSGMEGDLPLPDLNGGNDASAFDFGADLDGQNLLQDTNFDDWLASVGGENGQGTDGQASVGDAQFDASFFNLD